MKGFCEKYSQEFQSNMYNLILGFAGENCQHGSTFLKINVTKRGQLGCITATEYLENCVIRKRRLIKDYWKPVISEDIDTLLWSLGKDLKALHMNGVNTTGMQEAIKNLRPERIIDYRIVFDKNNTMFWV